MRELPEPWNTAAEQAGVRQTYRGIGERAGLSHVTVRRLIVEGRTTVSTVRKIADALGVEQATIYEWAGIELSEWGPWDPPASAHRMSPRTRAAVEELIRAITEGDAGWSATGSSEDPNPSDGGGEVVPLNPGRNTRRAARRTTSEGAAQDERLNQIGEESQDPGDAE